MSGPKDSTHDAARPGIYFGDSSERPELPEQHNYEIAEEMARQALLNLDPRKQADRCGATLGSEIPNPKSRIALCFDWFSRPVAVSFPDGVVRNVRDDAELPVWERIILLHYVGSIAPVSGSADLIGFNEVPSGSFYLDAFVRRSHNPLAGFFGSNPGLLHDAGELLGAARADLGDASVAVPVVPRLSVTAVVHGADDEFPADAKVLFPSSVVAYFCTEDIAVLGGFVAGRLIRAGRQIQGIAR